MKWILATLLIGTAIGLTVEGRTEQLTLRHLYTADRYSRTMRFSVPIAVFHDARRQELYIADAGTKMVVTLGQDGRSLGYFYHRRKGEDKAEPAGIAVDNSGAVFVSDSSTNRVYMYDYRGGDMGQLTMPDDKNGLLLPGKMAVDRIGKLYIAARNAGKVAVFDPNGRLRSVIHGAESLKACSDVAIDDDFVYLLSPKGTAVYVFDMEGKHVKEFGEHGPGKADFARPSGLDVDSKGRLWIVDSVIQVVKVFQRDGTFITMFGGFGSNKGAFFTPVDVHIDRETSTLFVVEKSGRRVQAFAIEEE